MADSDRRSTLLDSYENAAVIVSGIDADELGHSTPCPKYDVAGLIDHLVEAGHRAAALGRGQAPPPGDESPPWSSPTRRVNSVALRNRRHKRGATIRACPDVHHAVGRGVHGNRPGGHVLGRAVHARLGLGQGHRTDRKSWILPWPCRHWKGHGQ